MFSAQHKDEKVSSVQKPTKLKKNLPIKNKEDETKHQNVQNGKYSFSQLEEILGIVHPTPNA